jgi:hypothetical protein
MTADPAVARECAVLTRYLTGREPDAALVAAYERGLGSPGFGAGRRGGAFDRMLVRLGTRNTVLTRACDGFARFFHPGALLRRKLVLLLALLETRGDAGAVLDSPSVGSRAGFVLGLAGRGAVFAILLLAATVVLLPARLVLGRGTG